MAATAVIAAVAVGTTAYTANQQHEAQNRAERAARTEKRTLLAQRQAEMDAVEKAPQRTRAKIQGASGRADTILTGPLGLQGSASGAYQPKTLLGQ